MEEENIESCIIKLFWAFIDARKFVCYFDYKFYQCKVQASIKQTDMDFVKWMLSIVEGVAVDPYSHHGVQLTMVGHQ